MFEIFSEQSGRQVGVFSDYDQAGHWLDGIVASKPPAKPNGV
jgi:hypothetical protein